MSDVRFQPFSANASGEQSSLLYKQCLNNWSLAQSIKDSVRLFDKTSQSLTADSDQLSHSERLE